MKQQTERFTPAALTLSVVTAALADGIPQGVPVRRALWLCAVSAVCLCILSALAVAMLQNKAPSFAVRLALTAGLFMELMHTLAQAQGLCTAEFSSMALLGFLPLLLWAGWAVPPASWNASARVRWWFAAVGGVVCLLGLAGQLHWYRLFTPAQPTAANWDIPVYAEYFAGALLCSARSARRTVWLPVWGFAVQAAALLGSALLFGSETYPRLELLRAWSSGSFSRMDALLLLLWLLCAVYRAGRHPAALAGRGAHRHPALHRFGHPAKGAGACAAGLPTCRPQPIAHAGAAATACGAVHRTFAKLLAAGRGCAAPASPGSAAERQRRNL